MKPYVVVLLDQHNAKRGYVEQYESLTEAWEAAERLTAGGERAFPAAVLAAPEFLAGLRSGAV